MRSIKIAALACGLFVLGAVLYIPSTVHAQTPPDNGFNIITSPLPINLQAEPGSTLTTDIRIKNGGNTTIQLKTSLMKFAAYGEEGKPSLQARAPGDDYFDWVTFNPSTFDAPPNEWITVKMTIAIPKSAAFGYYYAATFSRANAPKPATSKQNVLIGSTAVLVLVDVKSPNAKRVATVTSFSADKRFYEFLPSTFTVKVRNSGNVHLIPAGSIFITRSGKPVATLDVNKVAGNVLPNSNRIFTASWDDGFPVYTQKVEAGKAVLDANGTAVKTLRWDLSKASHLKFGHYTAKLLLAYDNGNRDVPLQATVGFWVVPVRIIVGILVIAVLAGAGLWSIGHKIVKKLPKNKLKKSEK